MNHAASNIRYRFVMMTCTLCGAREMRRVRGQCKYCGEGLMTHDTGAVRITVKPSKSDEKRRTPDH